MKVKSSCCINCIHFEKGEIDNIQAFICKKYEKFIHSPTMPMKCWHYGEHPQGIPKNWEKVFSQTN